MRKAIMEIPAIISYTLYSVFDCIESEGEVW